MTSWYKETSTYAASTIVTMGKYDSLFVVPGIVLESRGAACVSATGGYNTVDVRGSIYGDYGINSAGSFGHFYVGLGGSVSGAQYGIYIAGNSNRIGNAGEISGDTGLYISGENTRISNSGTIFGTGDGAGVRIVSGDNVITNSGTISAVASYGLYLGSTTAGDPNVINNSGTISGGDDSAVCVDTGSTTTLNNTGVILGSIDFESGNNTYNGTAGSVTGTVLASAGTNVFYGGAGSETFDFHMQGADTVDCGGGNDTVYLGATFAAFQSIDGGAGKDTVIIDGAYATDVTITSDMMVNVEMITLGASWDYGLTTEDGVVGPGQTLTVDGTGVHASHALHFNGGDETDGRFILKGGAGNDVLVGGAGSDRIYGNGGNDTITAMGGTDTLSGGDGNDTLYLGDSLTSADRIDGGSGTDRVVLNGDYTGSHSVSFGLFTMLNVESIVLTSGHSYALTMNDGAVASGNTLTIDASGLNSSYALTFDGSGEANGHFTIKSGSGADKLTGGAQADTFVFTSAAKSTSTHYDTITDFNFGSDTFDIPGAVGTITGIDTTVAGGTLSSASFNTDLTTAMSGHLAAHHAILFKPTAGTLSGFTFLVVDLDGIAGYKANSDLVIKLSASSGTLTTGSFV